MQIIVFFDGFCGLCSQTVDFLIARDKAGRLRYSPLQGETAKRLLTETERPDLDTAIVVIESAAGTKKHKKSDAILLALSELSDWKFIASALRFIPRPIRNMAYDLIARNRFKLFKKRDTCRIPSANERQRFLP